MKKSWKLVTAATALAALTLAGCAKQQQSAATDHNASSSSLLVKQASGTIDSVHLSPQKTVSLVTVYAGNKFGGHWAKTAKAARHEGLNVDLRSTDDYQLNDKNQGVAYHVSAGKQNSQLVYTVNGSKVTIYQNAIKGHAATKLATVSRDKMAQFVNHYGQAQLVKQLAAKAQINDQRGSSVANSSNGQGSQTAPVGKYGNMGLATVPVAMRGKWYTADYSESSLTLGPHTINYDGTTITLYLPGGNFDPDNRQIQDATKDWGRTAYHSVHGLDFMNVRGWCQNAGDGDSYALHTETINGQKVQVLVVAGGAGYWTEAVYYRSADLAKQQANHHYDDLDYQ